MKTRFWYLMIVLLALVAITACGSAATEEAPADEAAPAEETTAEEAAPAEEEPAPEESGAYVVGYLVPNSAEGQIMFMESFKRYAEELGIDVIDVNADNNVEEQDRQCSDLIAQGVSALVTVPVDSEAIVACVDRATDAGIPVFGIDRQPFSADTVLTIMSNNYQAGQQGAQCVVDRLTEKYGEPTGTVLEITGDLGTNVAQLRGSGFNDEMANYPDIEVITQPTDWLPETGADVVQSTLAAEPELDAVYWHSDFTGAGVIPAMEEIGFLKPVGDEGHIYVCGIDGDPASLDRIRAGSQDATVNQPMLDFGVLAEFVKKYLDGEELSTGTYEQDGAMWSPAEIEDTEYGLTMLLGTWLVTQDNVEDPTLWGNYSPGGEAPAEEEAQPEPEAAEPYAVGYLVPNSAEGQIMFMESFKRYAEELGMDVIDVNADNNVEEQDRQCSDLISQGVSALVTVPVDSEAIVACVDRATQAGIPVFGIDRQPFSADTVMTVMSNNYQAGQQGAQCVVDRLTERYGEPTGTVLEITGDLGTNVAQLRGSGFNDEMANYPDIEVITQPTDWLPETGADVVQSTLAAEPELDAVYWHSDFTGAGVIPAIEEIGFLKPLDDEDHIFICGIDGDPASLDRIRAGSQDATVNQPMLDFGVLAEFVKKYLDGEELSTGTYEQDGAMWSPAEIEDTEYGLTMLLGTWLVTQENVEDSTLWGNQ